MDEKSKAPYKVGFVSSHGGHLFEALQLAEAFPHSETFFFSYDADTTRRLENVYVVPNKPYSPIRFVANLVYTFRIFRKERPAFIISTGAEIAIPAFLSARALGIPTAYVECGAQVTRPSLTGRILIRLSNHFFVQWPELLGAYNSKARYAGSLIDETPPRDAGDST